MRPVSISFRCFGPYVDEQTILFDELAENGLFLICGETGSGKTSILDAICCALYGNCSGEIRGELEAMRCKQADPEDPTEVRFVFECDGVRYCFARKLTRRKSRKADAPVSYNEDYSCTREENGIWVPLLDNAKKKSMNDKAEELIGLDLNQFRQVIILPQGRFETLLTSGSAEKESILADLFHTGRWQQAVDKMVEELKTRKDEIERETQRITDGLNRLQIASVGDLPEAVKAAETEAAAAAEAEKAAEKEKKRAQAMLDLKKEFEALDRCAGELKAAEENAKGDHALQVRLDMAGKAEKARRPFEEREQAERELKSAESDLAETGRKLERAKGTLAQAQEAKAAHEALAGEQQERENACHRLSGLKSRYENISTLQKAAEAARAKMEAAQGKESQAGQILKREEEKLKALSDAWNEAGTACRAVSQAYQAATAGHLAASLREGEPCPVCGNRHHPSPAALAEDAVTEKDVDAANERVSAAWNAYREQEGLKNRAEQNHRAAEQALGEAKSACDIASGAYRQELAQRDPEIGTLEELNAAIARLDRAIREYREAGERLLSGHTQALVAFNTLSGIREEQQARRDEALKTRQEKEDAWKKALADTGLGTEAQYHAMILPVGEQQKLRDTLAQHAAALEAAKKALAEQQRQLEGKERPDFAAAEQGFREADGKYREAIQAATLAAQKAGRLKQEAEVLAELDAKTADRRKAYEEDAAFARALRGSLGMSLQRYVLSVRLGQVLAEANRLLAGIYGGRYRLHRSDESYGAAHKSGLELEVYDAMNDQRRSVCTLSGGEKFLAALALAIGLCTVVQNEQKGVNLEAMFIDEGFGSLDQGTLGDALDVLQGIQRAHGLVGIISHVSLLEETIPTKIVIEKTPQGSRIRKEI